MSGPLRKLTRKLLLPMLLLELDWSTSPKCDFTLPDKYRMEECLAMRNFSRNEKQGCSEIVKILVLINKCRLEFWVTIVVLPFLDF